MLNTEGVKNYKKGLKYVAEQRKLDLANITPLELVNEHLDYFMPNTDIYALKDEVAQQALNIAKEFLKEYRKGK